MAEVFVFPGELSLGAKVRMARVGRHWRQVDLADQAGVPQTQVSALERGLNIYPHAEKQILQALGLVADGIERYDRLIQVYLHIPSVRRYFEKRRDYLCDGYNQAFTR